MLSFLNAARWSVRRLTERDRESLIRLLSDDPLRNVYLISRVLEDGVSGTQAIQVRKDGEPIVIALLGGNVTLSAVRGAAESDVSEAMKAVADTIFGDRVPVRAIISEAVLVEALWLRLGDRLYPPTVVRLNQPVYALTGSDGTSRDLARVRYSRSADLDALVPACAAMHLEEVGINPLERDAVGYRERIRELISKRRSLVLIENGRIVFKTEYSAVTPDAIQLMGVWTAPEARRRGLARSALREICGHILRQGKAVTLFVNDFNHPAIALYESLGFEKIGQNRALIW
jgi:uncharacterized protein